MQVRDFVSRYLPAYGAYLPELYEAARTTVVFRISLLAVVAV